MDNSYRLLKGGCAGFTYSAVLALLGGALAGAGHGSYWFGMYALSPFGVGFYMWPIIGLLLTKASNSFVRRIIVTFLLAHYAGLVYFLFSDRNDWSVFVATWKAVPEFAVLSSVVYLLGQVLIWRGLWRQQSARGASKVCGDGRSKVSSNRGA